MVILDPNMLEASPVLLPSVLPFGTFSVLRSCQLARHRV